MKISEKKKSGKMKVEKEPVLDTFQKVKAKVKHFLKKCGTFTTPC
jgi:hypothetical protein